MQKNIDGAKIEQPEHDMVNYRNNNFYIYSLLPCYNIMIKLMKNLKVWTILLQEPTQYTK